MFYLMAMKKIKLAFFSFLFLVAALSLFLNDNPVMAASTYPRCQGPLMNYDTNYGNDQFDCNLSDTNTYNYYCEETDSELAYCRSFASPSSDYYNCGLSTDNMIATTTGFLFVNCSLVDTFSVALTPISTSQIDVSWPATSYIGGTQVEQVKIDRYQCNLSSGNCWDSFSITVPSSQTFYSNAGLSSNTTYYFWIFPLDSASNTLSGSPMYSATTLSDSTPPAQITNLSVSSCSSASCSLSWTAPGNDGNTGTASSYDMRYSTSPINNDSSWASAIQATGEPAPAIAGTSQSMTVAGLSPTTTYYFTIKASDGANNVSPLSNTPTGTTTAVPDTTAPTSINPNLQAARDATNSSSQINISWNAYTDAVGVSGYRIERCQGALCSNFGFLTSVTSGTSYNDNNGGSDLPSSTSFSYRIQAYDAVPNFSGYSNTASASTSAPPDITAPVFNKISPADTLASGTLSTNLSGSTNEIAICRWADSTEQAFNSMNPMNPTTGGMNHTATITSLADGQSYYVKCRDTASTPNTSGDFFVFSVASPVPDTSPPQISNRQPSGSQPYFPDGSGTVRISVITNKPAYCRYNQNTDTEFNSMTVLNTSPSTDTMRYQIYHFTDITVFNGADYNYYVRCQDTTTTITNTSGSPPISFSIGTSPNILPTVNLSVAPTSGNAPLSVSASGSGNDSDGDVPLTYSLDWGDGFSEVYISGTSAPHTYNAAGSYTVTLTVEDFRGGRASDTANITVNVSQQVQPPPPITGGICAVECNDNSACVSIYGAGFVCGPSHICVPEATLDAGPVRSGGYASSLSGIISANFPAGTSAVIIGLTTEADAECRFAADPLTNNGTTNNGIAVDYNNIIMKPFSTSDYRNHFATIDIGKTKTCSPDAPNSCGYDKQDTCPTSGKCDSYGFSAVCRNTFGTLEPNTTDYPILFSIGAPELLACVPGEMCPNGLECPSSGRCAPAPYTCSINKYFVRNNIPYLLDICFPGFTP